MYWSFYWDATPNGYSVTEGGSSGSPLINNNRHIIGQLYGIGEGDCDAPARDISAYLYMENSAFHGMEILLQIAVSVV